MSQFFLPFALTVTFALLASLFVALTVIPVLAYFFIGKVNIKVDENGELPETIWQRLYTPVLQLALRSRMTRWATMGIALVLFLASLSLVSKIPTQFLDTGSEAILAVTVSPPAGASSTAVLAAPSRSSSCCWPTRTCSWSRRASRATPTPAPRRSSPPSRVAPATAPRSPSA